MPSANLISALLPTNFVFGTKVDADPVVLRVISWSSISSPFIPSANLTSALLPRNLVFGTKVEADPVVLRVIS